MEAYMRNQFPFLGIKSPERRMITSSHMKTTPLLSEKELVVVVKQLWKMKEREYQYFGQELIGYHKKIWSKNIIKLVEVLYHA
jgi:3-methyladenine DNA glycosylase AlkD